MFCKAFAQIETPVGDEIELAVCSLRAGERVPEIDDGFGELVLSCLIGKERESTQVADCVFNIESPAGKQTFQCRFFEKSDSQLKRENIQDWITTSAELLSHHKITLDLRDYRRWQLPSPVELHRLGRISGNRVPEEFGPTEMQQAVSKFGDGDVQGCMAMFSKMLADKDDAGVRNNLAFCQILTGSVAEGLESATKAVTANYEPLFEMNKGIAECLLGDCDAAKQTLANALKQLTDPNTEFQPTAAYVLVLDSTLKRVSPHSELPVDAAILVNLWRMGASNQHELEAGLTKIDAAKAKTWLAEFIQPRTT